MLTGMTTSGKQTMRRAPTKGADAAGTSKGAGMT
jgi:hypothetical protein